MGKFQLSAVILISLVAVALGVVKVGNELKMTKAYDAQASEQKRVADLMEAEKVLKETEFLSKLDCTVTRRRELVEHGEYIINGTATSAFWKNPVYGKVKTSVSCSEK